MLLLRCCAFLQSRVGGEIGGVVQGVRVALQQNVQNQVEPIPMHQQRQQADHVKVLVLAPGVIRLHAQPAALRMPWCARS